MTKSTTMSVEIRFGDCDPAGIVFYPRYHRWMDAASLNFFMSFGVPPWHVLERTIGVIGTPVLEHNTRFLKTATYGETLQIHTEVEEWRSKVFIQKHTITRGDDLLCESRETRAFCVRDPNERSRIRAIPIPEDVLERCR
ncbi:MAG: acyl-CoA thioesterase [Burkholderiaceae bacterium]|nr:acyl-CoA thioesterase [Burkholderiaceae bacterium]